MPTLQEISAKADELQASLDAEQVAIQTAIDGLNTTITDLQAQVAEGGTPEERQAIIDKLDAIKTDLEATIA